jgi:hypothetical protein
MRALSFSAMRLPTVDLEPFIGFEFDWVFHQTAKFFAISVKTRSDPFVKLESFQANWRGCLVCVKRLFDPLITEALRAEFNNEVKILRFVWFSNISSIKFPGEFHHYQYVSKQSIASSKHRSVFGLLSEASISMYHHWIHGSYVDWHSIWFKTDIHELVVRLIPGASWQEEVCTTYCSKVK